MNIRRAEVPRLDGWLIWMCYRLEGGAIGRSWTALATAICWMIWKRQRVVGLLVLVVDLGRPAGRAAARGTVWLCESVSAEDEPDVRCFSLQGLGRGGHRAFAAVGGMSLLQKNQDFTAGSADRRFSDQRRLSRLALYPAISKPSG